MNNNLETIALQMRRGNSIAWWAIGYYITVGTNRLPSIKIPIFDVNDNGLPVYHVLVDVGGNLMWQNVPKERVFVNKDAKEIGVKHRLLYEGLSKFN